MGTVIYHGHMKKKHEKVQMYTDWEGIVKEMFDVISVNNNQFRDFKGHFGRSLKILLQRVV
jgi:hypothetical protein